MTDPNAQEVLFSRHGRLGLVTLNRPQALNALNHNMCITLHRQLMEWAMDPDVKVVAVEGAGERAFCAGGDVVAMHAAGQAGSADYHRFFRDEYRLNQAIAHFPKPYVALMDGITMGGGVGISIHAPFRIATEATVFAMPEAAIGFVTDVGTTYALPRLPGEIGTWLGLTGARIGGADCVFAEIATHFVSRNDLAILKERLALAHEPVDEVLETFDRTVDAPPLLAFRDGIDYHFGHDHVEEIFEFLDEGDEWAQQQAAAMRAGSPTSLKLILHALREGQYESLESCLTREYRIASAMQQGQDFYEGVRAQLVDKDRSPRWNPASLDAVDIAPYLVEPAGGDIDFN